MFPQELEMRAELRHPRKEVFGLLLALSPAWLSLTFALILKYNPLGCVIFGDVLLPHYVFEITQCLVPLLELGHVHN